MSWKKPHSQVLIVKLVLQLKIKLQHSVPKGPKSGLVQGKYGSKLEFI
jgi:hypothetical protein